MDLCICYSLWVADGKNYLHVHPMFLHSNATSHKWVFGGMLLSSIQTRLLFMITLIAYLCGYFFWFRFAAIAELLDNAVDEVITPAV